MFCALRNVCPRAIASVATLEVDFIKLTLMVEEKRGVVVMPLHVNDVGIGHIG